jgi:hypothetical protein
MWYGYPVRSTSHLGNISNIGTKNVNVSSRDGLLLTPFSEPTDFRSRGGEYMCTGKVIRLKVYR